ncbi:30S ribosomal protein S6 [candidate division KSB1 bacterium]|nr:30S ribosomal protein S6 [candidate division KSB1 bacterium]
MIRQYETTFIVDAHLSTDEIEKVVSKYTQLMEKSKGKIKLIDRWGKRRLAYEIAKKQYGYYVYVRFEAEGTVVEALEKDFKLDDLILRYLVLRVPTIVIKEEIRKEAKSKAEAVDDAKKDESISDDSPEAIKKDESISDESSKVTKEGPEPEVKEDLEALPSDTNAEIDSDSENKAEEVESSSTETDDVTNEEEKPVSSE